VIRRSAPLLVLMLAACGTQIPRPVEERSAPPIAEPASSAPIRSPTYVLKQGGAFYQDDGPGYNPPSDFNAIADAVPRNEPLHRYANNPYSVLGHDYEPLRARMPYRARGIASWYGRKFHGQRTSSGESYDMYAMTAAHPTLPIPSYARVTNPANGRSVVVRINDRGPFHSGRVIDLSYTAAWKLGYADHGSTLVEVESVVPGQTLPAVGRPQAFDDDPIAQFAAVAEPASVSLPEIREAQGIYLQLGAFGNADNAEALRSRLARELGGLSEHLVVRAARGWYRLQLGPWKDRDEAHRIADLIAERLELRPVVVRN
jgi:rare lipoprotein A